MKAYHTSQLSTLSSQLSSCPQKAAELQFQVQTQRSCWFKVQMRYRAFKVAHRFSQISKIYLSEKRESGSPLARERFKRRSIVYTPTLLHSHTPKNFSLLTCHFSLRQLSLIERNKTFIEMFFRLKIKHVLL